MKRVNNELVTVYSHKRSGTNYLCALLYLNFYKGRNFTGKESSTNLFQTDTGEVVFYNKWGALFGDHIHPNRTVVRNRSIYIKRNVMDTARSFYRRRDLTKRKGIQKNISFEDFSTLKIFKGKLTIIEHIQMHHKKWEKYGCYCVQYETLLTDTESIINDISKKFKLRFSGEPVYEIGYVGWIPSIGEKY